MPHCLELHMDLYLCSDLVCKLSSNYELKDSLHKEHFLATGLFLGHLILYSLECTTLTFFLIFFFGWGGNLCFSWVSCGSGNSWASDSDWSPPSVDSWAFSHHFCSLLFIHASQGVKSPGSGSLKLIWGGGGHFFVRVIVSKKMLFPKYTSAICTAEGLGNAFGWL